ncbi:MAG TPA: GMP synthase (glutamine-hydrolyzing) [Firmicutes bacterium]|jgi:GMP synthase (glutamine-hydrolysing)|nr:GMP synthase (glutamine-hydrolyzing) [Bacillota bacterium]
MTKMGGLSLKRILVVDYGSNKVQDVAREVREMGVYSEVVPASSLEQALGKEPRGIIPVGPVPSEVLQKLKAEAVPICLSGDLQTFLHDTCGDTKEWNMDRFLAQAIEQIRAQVGTGKVICGLSGGVDSSVAAVLVHKAIGEQLTCVYVDHGFMRAGETEQIVRTFQGQFGIPLIHVDAQDRFIDKLQGIEDPEQKRKIIGAEFIRVFEEEAAKIGDAAFLVQGTVYSDVIESGDSAGKVVKSHHNVGGLPDDFALELVEPLATLFKNEVRILGEKLQIPSEILWRHPFPGPGLAIRLMGAVTREKLEILRAADALAMEEVRKAGWYDKIWQALVVLTDTRTVGVFEGERTYDYVVALRFVTSTDAMSADWVRVPYDLLDTISRRLMTEVKGVNRVVYDISSKPPATIEWE